MKCVSHTAVSHRVSLPPHIQAIVFSELKPRGQKMLVWNIKEGECVCFCVLSHSSFTCWPYFWTLSLLTYTPSLLLRAETCFSNSKHFGGPECCSECRWQESRKKGHPPSDAAMYASISSNLLHTSTRPEPLSSQWGLVSEVCGICFLFLISKRISEVDGSSCHPEEAFTLLKSYGQTSFLMALPPLAPLKRKTCTCYLPDRSWQRFYGRSSLDDHDMMRLMVKSCFQSWVGLVCVHLSTTLVPHTEKLTRTAWFGWKMWLLGFGVWQGFKFHNEEQVCH